MKTSRLAALAGAVALTLTMTACGSSDDSSDDAKAGDSTASAAFPVTEASGMIVTSFTVPPDSHSPITKSCTVPAVPCAGMFASSFGMSVPYATLTTRDTGYRFASVGWSKLIRLDTCQPTRNVTRSATMSC